MRPRLWLPPFRPREPPPPRSRPLGPGTRPDLRRVRHPAELLPGGDPDRPYGSEPVRRPSWRY